MLKHLVVGIVSLVWSASVGAETITVCQDGSCDFADIQSAINSAMNGDLIDIYSGVYFLDEALNTNGKAITLQGAVGSDGELSTIIDGQQKTRICNCSPSEGQDANFNSLVFQNGFSSSTGGALYCSASSPIFENCLFQYNRVVSPEFGKGGAVRCTTSSGAQFSECVFHQNEVVGSYGQGGAIYNQGSIVVANCRFYGNHTEHSGGAITTQSGWNAQSQGIFNGCTFEHNSAVWGGAFDSYCSQNTLYECLFVLNEAGWGGAFIQSEGTVHIERCDFVSNRTTVSGGGGIRCETGSLSVTQSTFTANNAAGGGGGISVRWGTLQLYSVMICGNEPDQITGKWSEYGRSCISDICAECTPGCHADLDGNSTVDGADLTQLLAEWGCAQSDCVADIDGSGLVDGADLTIILAAWGPCDG